MEEFTMSLPPLPGALPQPELDAWYLDYAAALPAPLDRLARNRELFNGKRETSPITSLKQIDRLVTVIPWLFREAFPAVTDSELTEVTKAGVLLILAFLIYDYYLDGQIPAQPEILLLQHQLHTDALRRFQTLFEAGSPFWNCFDRYFHEYTTALLREREHCGQVTEYSLETLWQIGAGKAALCKVPLAALAVKARAEDYLPRLETAFEALMVGLQLSDDLMDWEEDYQSQNYTLALTWLIPAEQWPIPQLTVAELDQRRQDSVICETLLKQVVAWFHLALDSVADLLCPHWVTHVTSRLNGIESYRRSVVAAKLLEAISSREGN